MGTTWDLGGGGNAFSFDHIGDEVSGYVLDLIERQSTKMETGLPDTWDNGDPKMISIVTLQTELCDPGNPADDGQRTVTLAGSKKPETESRMAAVVAAVKAATGGTALAYKGWLRMQYYADGEQTRKGFSAPKRYRAMYKAPAMELDQPAETRQQAQQRADAAMAANAAQKQANNQDQWPAGDAGPGPQWAQQEPPVDPWANQQPQQAAPVIGVWGGQPTQQGQQPSTQQWQQQPQVQAATQNAIQNPSPQTVQIAHDTAMAAQQAGGPAAPTQAQIAGLQAIGVDPAQVYGPDWASRVVG